MEKGRIKSIASFFLKLALVSVLLVFMAKRGFLSFESIKNAAQYPGKISIAVALMLISTFLGIIRWNILLKALKIQLPNTKMFSIAMIGSFFNVALPGAVSGDVIKAIFVAQEVEGVRAKAFSSIFFDRVLGVSALFLISGFALLLSAGHAWAIGVFTPLKTLLIVAGAIIVGFYAFLFGLAHHWDPFLPILKNFESKLKPVGSIRRIYEGILEYRSHPVPFAMAFLLTLIIHSFIVIAFQLLFEALGVTDLSLNALFVVVPLGIFVSGIPVLPAGIGTGHAAFAYLLYLLGSQTGADAFNFLVLFNLALGALGSLFWIQRRKRHFS